ncbi:hypothetical protein [Rossellomorea vietnamensis]|nr:hypothetical protein [Rossellomorea vietnamensis]MCC5804312.1 hypothetical protein [Rossellomorea vietnamensis]
MGEEKESLSEELKKRDLDFDKKMEKYDKEIDQLKKSIFKDWDGDSHGD